MGRTNLVSKAHTAAAPNRSQELCAEMFQAPAFNKAGPQVPKICLLSCVT